MKLGERGRNFQSTGDIEMSVYLSDTGNTALLECCCSEGLEELGVDQGEPLVQRYLAKHVFNIV